MAKSTVLRTTSSLQDAAQSVAQSVVLSLIPSQPRNVKRVACRKLAAKLATGDYVVDDDSITLSLGDLELNLVRDEMIDQIVLENLAASVLTSSVQA